MTSEQESVSREGVWSWPREQPVRVGTLEKVATWTDSNMARPSGASRLAAGSVCLPGPKRLLLAGLRGSEAPALPCEELCLWLSAHGHVDMGAWASLGVGLAQAPEQQVDPSGLENPCLHESAVLESRSMHHRLLCVRIGGGFSHG